MEANALARGFHELDENLFRVGRGGEEEIDASAVCTSARGGIERFQREPRAQDFRRAIHIANVNFDLLNSFAEFLQEARNGPGTFWLAA